MKTDLDETPAQHDVFISYSSHNKQIAEAVCSALENNNIKCWIAPRDIIPGETWAKAIIDGINGCKIVVIIFSAHSNSSDQVINEIERAVSKRKTIIPFRLEDIPPTGDMELFLARRHWLDAMTPPLEAHIEKLSATIIRFLDIKPASPKQEHPIDEAPIIKHKQEDLKIEEVPDKSEQEKETITYRDTESQKPLTGRQTIHQFDTGYRVMRPPAPLLTESVTMEKGRNNSLFLSGEVGVSFDQAAAPETSVKIRTLNLSYEKDVEDGNRMRLVINNIVINALLPDWMLVPIASYVESPYFSCISLSGKLKDKALGKTVTEHNGRVINYHPAFDNTLLGIRLAFMEMLVGYAFATDVPKNKTGDYILGRDEVTPDTDANKAGAYYLSQHLIRTENKYKLTFRSYIISDYLQKITFTLKNDSLVLSGYPFYYCWKYYSDNNEYDINKVAKELSTKYRKKIGDFLKSSDDIASRKWIIDKLISLAEQYDGNYGFYSEGTFTDMVKLKSYADRRHFLGKFTIESLFEMVIDTEAYMSRDSVIYLKELSEKISSAPELFEAANPAVWNATVGTMRFAAFFRYVKTSFPETWREFVNQLKMIEPEPQIETPTVMFDSNDKVLEELINDAMNRQLSL